LADSDEGLIGYSLTTIPSIPIYNVDGSYSSVSQEGYTNPNPIAMAMMDEILLKRQKLGEFQLAKDIGAEMIVACPHWGTEGTYEVTEEQIRFNDIDKFGHVNNAVYFQFYDTAKTDYFAMVCKGVDWERVAIVVVKVEAEFVAQIKAGDHIAARTRTTKIGNKSFHLEQDIIDTDTREVKCRCLSVMVLYDLTPHQSIPFPAAWRQAICEYDSIQ